MSVSTRRGLLGGAAALAAAPAAAMPGGLHQAVLPSAHPDADLIAACAEFDACERAYGIIHGTGLGAIEDDDEAGVASAPFLARQRALLDRMDELRAATPAGVQARAYSLALHAGHGAYSFDAFDTTPGRLLVYLMRDAAALGGSEANVKLGNPDAKLAEACAEFHALEARRPVPTGQALIFGTPECNRHEEMQNDVTDLQDGVVSSLATMPATTLEDMRRKATVLLEWDGGNGLVEDAADSVDRLAFSLVRDLLGGPPTTAG